MKQVLSFGLSCFLVASLAQADDGGSAAAGAASADSGASVAVAGSEAFANGNLVGASVAVPLGLGSVALGGAGVVGGAVLDAAVAPFGQALEISNETVIAPQAMPAVPYQPTR